MFSFHVRYICWNGLKNVSATQILRAMLQWKVEGGGKGREGDRWKKRMKIASHDPWLNLMYLFENKLWLWLHICVYIYVYMPYYGMYAPIVVVHTISSIRFVCGQRNSKKTVMKYAIYIFSAEPDCCGLQFRATKATRRQILNFCFLLTHHIRISYCFCKCQRSFKCSRTLFVIIFHARAKNQFG